jgi:dTDP-glucose 4,6-dehydratase
MILVTGGAGFIGSAFASLTDCLVYDSLTYAGRNSHPRLARGDVRDVRNLERVVRENGVDVIVNFAAETHVDRSIVDPLPFVENNVLGAVSVLEVARRTGCRLLHVSTDEVYGDVEGADESYPLKPSSPYSASKASADLFVLAYVRTYGVDALVVRPSNNYGPRQHPEKFIPKAIIRTLMGMEVPVYGDGRQRRDWIYVEDTASLIMRLVSEGEKGQVYNLPGGHVVSNLELLQILGEVMGRGVKVKFVGDRPGHDRVYSMRTKLRYTTTPLREGLRRTVNWYLENRAWWEPLLEDRFVGEVSW